MRDPGNEVDVCLQEKEKKKLLLGNYTLLRVPPIHRRERLLGELKELAIRSQVWAIKLPAALHESLVRSFKELDRNILSVLILSLLRKSCHFAA